MVSIRWRGAFYHRNSYSMIVPVPNLTNDVVNFLLDIYRHLNAHTLKWVLKGEPFNSILDVRNKKTQERFYCKFILMDFYFLFFQHKAIILPRPRNLYSNASNTNLLDQSWPLLIPFFQQPKSFVDGISAGG